LLIFDCRFIKSFREFFNRQLAIANRKMPLLGLFMVRVFTAAPAELAELKTISRGLLVLGRNVVATLAISTLQHDIVTRHA
jgi:hypothetical protein